MTWTIIWATIGGLALGAEIVALVSPAEGDTLSEHVWRWLKVGGRNPTTLTWVLRGLVAVFLIWLLLHFEFGWFTPSDPAPW